jgi:hypothetical protein
MENGSHLPFSIALTVLLACGGPPSPSIQVDRSQRPTVIEVRGLPRRDIGALRRATLTMEQWQQILRVNLRGAPMPITGKYTVERGMIRFTPMFDFDNWRSFEVTFDAAQIPGADPSEPWRTNTVTKMIAFEGMGLGRATYVKHVYPSAAELPENMLRFYIEFSAPMGRASALDHIRLIAENGDHVMDPFLSVEAEFWTPDRTRFTLFFDPGRVKRGIKPNRDLGRALVRGKHYALVIGERWPDGRSQPLKSTYRHEFSVIPALEKPLDQRDWKIQAPKPSTRDPLVVTFPWPLDYGLLQRALGVRRGGAEVPGEIAIDDGEKRWTFTPRDPWATDSYTLIALTLLEDPAGNRLGRAFEVMEPSTDERDFIELSFLIK